VNATAAPKPSKLAAAQQARARGDGGVSSRARAAETAEPAGAKSGGVAPAAPTRAASSARGVRERGVRAAGVGG
jgi:hypothetical protein